MPARTLLIFTGLLPLLLATAPPASRVLKSIDFEERRLGNREDLPMHWAKIAGAGLPNYDNARLSNDRAHSGQWSFRFDLNGGSLIYQYDPHQVPAEAGAHYRVQCFVQTSVLPHARTRLTAFFTDLDGHTITSSVGHSDLYAAQTDGEPWHELSLELTARESNAAFLAVQLELLQPNFYASSTLGRRTLFDEDIYGSAWFDDLTIAQIPQVRLSTDRPGNIFRRSQPLRLAVRVSDRFTEDLAVQLHVSDASGAAVYQHSGALDIASAQDLGRGETLIWLNLPDLKPGWYDAALALTSRGQFVGRQDLHLVRLADDDDPGVPDPRFGVMATDLPFAGWGQLPQVLPILAVGRVKLAVWSRRGDVEQMDSAAFDSLLQQLAIEGITPTACLTALPPQIAQRVGGNDWRRLLDAPPDQWRPDLAYLVARHANYLDRWQFGDDADAAAFLENPDLGKVYDSLYDEFARVMVKPDLAMPWPAWCELSGHLPATIALSVPPDVLPSQLPLYIQDLGARPGHHLSLSLQLLDERWGRQVQIRDLAQRVVYALAGGATRIDLPLPLLVHSDGDDLADEPTEMLLIIRTLARELAGTTFKGKIPNASNVDAFLFDRHGQGIVVLWNRGDDAGAKPLALNLGHHAERIDLWGNAEPLFQTANDNDMVNLDVGAMPFFLLDVDSVTTQIRASVGLDKPLLESSFTPHTRRIHFANPGPSTISGTLRLIAPDGWTLTPAIFSFTLNPGETFNQPLSIEFPYNSFAGAKTITAHFQYQSDRDTSFSVPVTVSLGLSDVGMRTMALRDKNDLIVQQIISNYGEKPINYTAFVVYPGQPRQERLVTQLGPGRTVIKLYRFSNVQIIPNAKVRSGLHEVEGTRILNDEVRVQ